MLLGRDGPVAILTLNRPERLNAYTTAMGAELMRAFAELDDDDATRVIIVTGAGRGFCAGADLERGGDTFAGEGAFDETRQLEHRVRPWNLKKPIIAAINGPAVGIGATLPLGWDLRIASDRARIGFVFVRRGIVPEANSTWLLPRLVGVSRALDLLLTGRIVEAPEALALGLVSRVVPHDSLLDVAREMAHDIARNTAPLSVAITRRLVWRSVVETSPIRAKALEDELFDWIGKQADAAEGVRAFLEKRAPEWSLSPARDFPDALAPLDE